MSMFLKFKFFPKIPLGPSANMGFTNMEQTNYVTISVFAVIFIAIVAVILSYKLFCNSATKQSIDNKMVKYTAMIQLISFLLSYITWMIQVFIPQNQDALFYGFSSIMYITWAIGWVSIYAFMTLRLYHTFQDSIYSMSKRSIIFHATIIIIIPIWYLALVLEDHIVKDMQLYLIIAAIGFPIIFVGLSRLIWQFNRKLFQLIASQRRSIVTDEDIEPVLTDRQLLTLGVMTKHTLLGTFTLSFCLVFMLIISIVGLLQIEQDTAWIVYEWFLAVLVIVNIVCVYFGFSINKKEYDFCCYRCHWCCRNCCERCAERYMVKNDNAPRRNYITLK